MLSACECANAQTISLFLFLCMDFMVSAAVCKARGQVLPEHQTALLSKPFLFGTISLSWETGAKRAKP